MNRSGTLSKQQVEDTELIRRSRDGDHAAFGEIVERYESRVAATVIGMLGRCPEADDVGQDTFIRFHKALHQFRAESSLATYLTRIAVNLSLNELKKRKRHIERHERTDEHFDKRLPESAKVEFAWDDRHEIVTRCIQQLPEIQRSVVVLRLIQGYSTQETADLLDIPLGTVLSRLARAQTKLKALLLPYMNDYDS